MDLLSVSKKECISQSSFSLNKYRVHTLVTPEICEEIVNNQENYEHCTFIETIFDTPDFSLLNGQYWLIRRILKDEEEKCFCPAKWILERFSKKGIVRWVEDEILNELKRTNYLNLSEEGDLDKAVLNMQLLTVVQFRTCRLYQKNSNGNHDLSCYYSFSGAKYKTKWCVGASKCMVLHNTDECTIVHSNTRRFLSVLNPLAYMSAFPDDNESDTGSSTPFVYFESSEDMEKNLYFWSFEQFLSLKEIDNDVLEAENNNTDDIKIEELDEYTFVEFSTDINPIIVPIKQY